MISVLKTVGLSVFILCGIYLASWAGAPRYVLKPVQKIYESPSSISLIADPSLLNPPEAHEEK